MTPDEAAAMARDIYEMEWPDRGDEPLVLIVKGGIAWATSGKLHPAHLINTILDGHAGPLPEGPWDAVALIGTAYAETHSTIETAAARFGKLQAVPTPDTWHVVSVYAITGAGHVAVTWKSTINGDGTHDIDLEPFTILDHQHGAVADHLSRLARVGLIA